MSDSIFDLKQTLFTSNLPVPASRDRGADRGPNFDQALDSAQRQGRDEHRAHESQKPKAADNKKNDDTNQADDVQHDDQDEVTLTKEGAATETATTNAKEAVVGEPEVKEEIKEPTTEEIAAAAVAPLDPSMPVIKQAPKEKTEHGEHHEGIELNDAVQLGGKHGRAKTTGKEALAANTLTNAAPIKNEELAATTEEAAAVDPNAVVVATELHSTKVAAANKNARGANKTEQTKSNSDTKTDQPVNEETKTDTGEHAEGAFAVTVTPEVESETPTPKRRFDTTKQSMPEVSDSELKLASAIAVNATAAAAATPGTSIDSTTDTTAKTAETPGISAVSTAPTETPPPSNQPRGQQIPTSFANRLEAAAAERKSNDSLNGVDRTRFVQRVARAFQRAGETEGEIRLRLSPPELGAVKLEVTLRDGAMIARMETETTTARNLLMDNLPQLKERLAEQNVRIETFEVEVRDQSNQSSADDAKEQLRQQTEQQRNRLRGERATTPVVAAPIVRTLPAARQSSQLNVVI
jgi:flagellar hook-length control protein FliK